MSALAERELAQAAAFVELIAEHHAAGDVAAAGELEEQLLELRGWVRQWDGRYRDTSGSGSTFARHAALNIIAREVTAAGRAIGGAMAKGAAA